MALTLTNYPVTVDSGRINNTFAGFQPVALDFKREDIQINSVGSGANNKAEIVITGDITGDVLVGEFVYLYAVGSTYIYDVSAEVLEISYSAPDTTILIDADFIEISSTGYLNYKHDYFVQCQLVNPDNTDIKVYKSEISDVGTPAGIVSVNLNPPVDLLKNEILTNSGEVSDGRIKFKAQYREVWRDNENEAYILIDDTDFCK
jgi:hypothetical protein